METVRNINKQYEEYLMIRSHNDKPIDLTRANAANLTTQQDSKAQLIGGSGNPMYFQSIDNQAEILKAAKSLFSKRTRTLYHWMYPTTPKFQLKSAVALAWDTMGVQEKQFYISQVLGKFGYLQSSLMINPQLGCMPLPQLNLAHSSLQHHHQQVEHNVQPDLSNVETTNAVSNLLQNIVWNQPSVNAPPIILSKKRGRPRGSKRLLGDNKHGKSVKRLNSVKHPKVHVQVDEFNDDPELRKELEQFQWALHLVEK